ncbi:MAG: class II glutamine amidotransferase [Eubacteriales bacterium]|nr:class II glutamine amidotransferase [Eubacteriales bacterium]
MCELFGFSARNQQDISSYLKEFYTHSKMHPHGWGLVTLDGNEAMIEKEPMQASKSNYLKERLTVPVSGKTVFAHIRYATIGNVEYQNCHPYSKKDKYGRRWTLVHNGTIFEYPILDKYVKTQWGDTDSERILLYIVDRINEMERDFRRELTAEERFQLLDSIVVHMSKGNKLNLLIFDGEQVYVHTNYANSLHYLEQNDWTMFSTEPLTQEAWHPVPFTQLLAFQQGKLVYQGTQHGNTYVDSEENLKYLYQAFSDL